jgi:putative tryptophan/tyrosine transport system substrate-binding protein
VIDLLGFSLSKKLGWTEGRNIRIDTRWAAADIEAMQRFAKELVGSQPELIFSTNTHATATLQQTRTIPIVFWPSGRRARE